MNRKKTKSVVYINLSLAIKAIDLREIADELSKQFVKLDCENAASVREQLNRTEMKLADICLNISNLQDQIYSLIND